MGATAPAKKKGKSTSANLTRNPRETPLGSNTDMKQSASGPQTLVNTPKVSPIKQRETSYVATTPQSKNSTIPTDVREGKLFTIVGFGDDAARVGVYGVLKNGNAIQKKL